MRQYIRHEIQAVDTWHSPPASLELNHQIAHALLVLKQALDDKDESRTTYVLDLTMHDCLVIDACVPQDAKDVNGIPIGLFILLKSFQARERLLTPESQ